MPRYSHEFAIVFSVENDDPDVNNLTNEEILAEFQARIADRIGPDELGYENTFDFETGDCFTPDDLNQ